MFLSLKTLYRKRTVIWPFYFYTIIRTLSMYANDYDKYMDEIENMAVEESYIGDKFSEVKSIMKGFLSETDIRNIGKIYFSIIMELIQKMKGNV